MIFPMLVLTLGLLSVSNFISYFYFFISPQIIWRGCFLEISLSFQYLSQKPFAPKKYFSIDRVFRNEAVDRTHLAEFHQIEGIYD